MTPIRWPALALAAVLPLALSGCPDLSMGPDPATGAAEQGLSRDLTLLSEHDAANWSDLAVGTDGTLHAVFQDTPKGGVAGIYHRASSDGGASWSAPHRLNERDHHAGVPRVAVDGQGRLYAFWKDMSAHEGGWMAAGTGDSLAGGPYGRPLMARVLDGGTWSEPFRVSASAQVVSWFPAVDPAGAVHVVWAENIKSPNGYQTTNPALVLQARVAGAQAEAPKEVYRGKPDGVPEDYDGTAWYYESLLGLRGYVDAQGVAHWVAARRGGRADETELAHWNGTAFQKLMSYDAYAGGIYYNPPELVLDASGREHVLVQDGKGERKGLLDFLVGEATPRVVRQAQDATGELKTFQVARGRDGRLAAMMAFRDTNAPGSEFDLFVSRYEGGDWTPAVNVTSNAQRGTYKEFGDRADGTQVSTTYEPAFSAGVFDAQGRLNLALVNQEKLYVNTTRTGTYMGEPVRATDGGVVALPKVFFVRL